jgi:hypothetical protein
MSNWEDACDFLEAYLGDDEARSQRVSKHMMDKTPGALIDGFGGLSMVLVQRLVHAQGAVGTEEIRRMAREAIRQLRFDPPPGY